MRLSGEGVGETSAFEMLDLGFAELAYPFPAGTPGKKTFKKIYFYPNNPRMISIHSANAAVSSSPSQAVTTDS